MGLSLHVDGPTALKTVVSKAPDARCVIPELADDDYPEGWEVHACSRSRITSTVGGLIKSVVDDLEESSMLHMPQVQEQVTLLKDLLAGSSPFTFERDRLVSGIRTANAKGWGRPESRFRGLSTRCVATSPHMGASRQRWPSACSEMSVKRDPCSARH